MLACVYLLAMSPDPLPWPLTGLGAADRQRALRFRRPEDQASFVAGRRLLDRLVEDQVGGRRLPLAIGAYGRPGLTGPGSERIDVNISHCDGLVAAAVCSSGRIGVDVESAARPIDVAGLARRYFLESEVVAIAAAAESERSRAFLRYWTAKEAALKAIGRGLLIPLDQVSIDADFSALRFAPALGEDAATWRLLTRDFGTHVLAVAVSGAEASTAELRERWLTRADLGV